MVRIQRAFRTAQIQMEEAAATARIRSAYSDIIVSNSSELFSAFKDQKQKQLLEEVLRDKDTDTSMLYRGLVVQISGIFENFVKAIIDAVIVEKVSRASKFSCLEEKLKREYFHRAATILTHEKEGHFHGRKFDFEKLRRSMGGCALDIGNFRVDSRVFTVAITNVTSIRLANSFEQVGVNDPLSDSIGEHQGLKQLSGETSSRKVAKFVRDTLDEQVAVRNEFAHGNITRSVAANEFQFCSNFFTELMDAIRGEVMKAL